MIFASQNIERRNLDTELPSRMGKQRTLRETPFAKKRRSTHGLWAAIRGTSAYLFPSRCVMRDA